MNQSQKVMIRIQAVLLLIIGITALKLTQTVTMPLALAIFLLFIAWPLQTRLRRHLSRFAAYLVTLLAMGIVLAAFIAGIVFSIEIMAERLPPYTAHLDQLLHQGHAWLQRFGLPFERLEEFIRQLLGGVTAAASTLLGEIYTVFETALVTAAYITLGLWEAPQFLHRMRRATTDQGVHEVVDMLETMMHQYERYVFVRTLSSTLIGISTIVYCWLIGLDFALAWGLLGFLLNYIPVIGAVVAVIPPVLFALVQYSGLALPLSVLAVLSLIHFVIGNYIDPLLQWQRLAMSPLVVLFSVLFWGWVWGIAGALLGVPLMVAVVIVTSHFPATRWIALLLADISTDAQREYNQAGDAGQE